MIVASEDGKSLFGPFTAVANTGDSLVCDGAIFPLFVVGAGYHLITVDCPGPLHEYTWENDDFKHNAPNPTDALVKKDYVDAMEAMFDRMAQTRGYDNRITCAMRAGYPGYYRQQGIAFGTWMDNCNFIGFSLMNQVLAGEVPKPTIAEYLASLPTFVWPD